MITRTVLSIFSALVLISAPCAYAQRQDDISSQLAAEEREGCIKNLKMIYEAIQSYRKDHKELPNWISDLVPKYLADPKVLICPVTAKTGRTTTLVYGDPKVVSSYIFEFSAAKPNWLAGMTMKEWKQKQMGLVGSVVPILRCHGHNDVINLGFDGNIYSSKLYWEHKFTNLVSFDHLMPVYLAALYRQPSETTPANLSREQKIEQQIAALRRHASEQHSDDIAAAAKEFAAGIHALMKDYPNSAELWSELLFAARSLNKPDAERLLAEIIASNAEDQTIQRAKGTLKSITAVGKPLRLTFVAADGRNVDFEKMKGKVVMVDFWASWCGPCMASLPEVLDIYKKYHGEGFEIVGINLDGDRTAMDRVLKKYEMSWPQYFDGKAWDNRIAQEYAVGSIPSIWLVDKVGILRTVEGRVQLEEQIKRLLAENL